MNEMHLAFLLRAKQSTYAANGAQTAPSRPNSHDLSFSENDLLYIDSYLGGALFSGEEALWEHDVPIWAMNYSGRVLKDSFDGDFLKLALMHGTKNNPHRGPERFSRGEFEYRSETSGNPEWFQGYETILRSGELIYECFFHGGAVL